MIPNRGEIALRIIRACRGLGIKTVALYSDQDRNSGYVKQADESFHLGPSIAKESYLNVAQILSIAKKCKADAIHPGYGFLSENADFAEICDKNKIVFIGPSSLAIRKIGDKIQAKKLAQKLGIPVVDGITECVNLNKIKAFISKNGLPILLKAKGGGGGRGMRVVRDRSALEKSYKEAANEAESYFKDKSLFVEKYILKPRHIEVQILADKFGNAVHLFERECSIQRRHQKLIEESPSVTVRDDKKNELFVSALKLIKASGYTNAGTVEFLVEGSNFYFLEVNTRLQVEHPVTEMLTGIDIVKEQIKIASGERLTYAQNEIAKKGHAIECRILAENALDGFIPSLGRITAFRPPKGPFVRVDADLANGTEISAHYDSLIAKVICCGMNRFEAIANMKRALSEFVVAGIHTTIPFHLAMMRNKNFAEGEIYTRYVEEKFKLRQDDKLANTARVIASVLEFNLMSGGRSAYAKTEPISSWKQAFRNKSKSQK